MSETSYPLVKSASGPSANISRPMWETIFGNGDGILGDINGADPETNGDAFPVALSGNTATVGTTGKTARYRMDGHIFELVGTKALTLAAAAATYTIGVLRTPANESATGGPLSLVAGTSITVPSGGKYAPLWSVTRTTSAMSSSTTRENLRHWAGELVQADTVAGLPPSPRGSVGVVNGTVYHRVRTGSTLSWVHAASAGFVLAGGGALVQDFAVPGFRVVDGEVRGFGNLKRESGAPLNNGANVILGTVAAGARPVAQRWFLCATNNAELGVVVVGSDGVVQLVAANSGLTFVRLYLDSVRFEAEQ